ncbi:MAG: choloylglycine hydrolase family protein [Thermodesulfobacteriota bacterium]
MKRSLVVFLATALAAFSLLAIPSRPASACTGIVLTAEDGSPVYARTMEFGRDVVTYSLLTVPRGYSYAGHLPGGKPGMAWKVKYGHVGFNPEGLPAVTEGLNEKGLSVGSFYLPGFAEYQPFDPARAKKTISNLDVVPWLLGSFATTAEIREALPKVAVVGLPVPQMGGAPPLHYIATDPSGQSVVIQYVAGKLTIYDNKVGVITNSPEYPWHLTNLRNYIGISPLNLPSVQYGGENFSGLSQGTGMLGLPGDFTSPSRFVRANYFAHTALPGKDGFETIEVAFRILNQFDIPRGSLRNPEGGKTIYDVAQWTVAYDLRNWKMYFHTFESRRVRVVDLGKLDFSGGQILTQEITGPEQVEDVSGAFQPYKAPVAESGR